MMMVPSANPATEDTAVTVTDTVTAPSGGVTPTGSVTFFNGAIQLGVSALTNGVASFLINGLAAGIYNIVGIYSGDGNYLSGTASCSLPVDDADGSSGSQAGSTTTLSTSGAPSTLGDAVTLSVNVAAVSPATGTPTGSVTFYDGDNELGQEDLDDSGNANLTVDDLTAGVHDITAIYSGDDNFISSEDSLTQCVNPKDSSTDLSLSTGSSVFGQAVTLTANVPTLNGVTPTGTVIFYDGTNIIRTATLDDTGTATAQVKYLSPGDHTITAVYSGDTNYASSTSDASDLTVTQADTTTTESAVNISTTTNDDGETVTANSVTTSVYGQDVTLVATVTPISPGSGIPTGTVTFSDAAGTIGTAPVNGNGIAYVDAGEPAAGDYTITASYSGDTNFEGSTSDAGDLTITPLVVTLTGSRTYDSTTAADASILTVSNAVGSDTVDVTSGIGTAIRN